jgi:glycerol uptake facilitator-like aquaporin
MFDLDAFQLSQNSRSGINIFLSESIATFGLLMIILGTLRLNSDLVAPSVGLYISAGYWFTSSTSFANPAVTFARIFTDTFTGIFYLDAACFIVFQILGAIFAFKVFKSLEN